MDSCHVEDPLSLLSASQPAQPETARATASSVLEVSIVESVCSHVTFISVGFYFD